MPRRGDAARLPPPQMTAPRIALRSPRGSDRARCRGCAAALRVSAASRGRGKEEGGRRGRALQPPRGGTGTERPGRRRGRSNPRCPPSPHRSPAVRPPPSPHPSAVRTSVGPHRGTAALPTPAFLPRTRNAAVPRPGIFHPGSRRASPDGSGGSGAGRALTRVPTAFPSPSPSPGRGNAAGKRSCCRWGNRGTGGSRGVTQSPAGGTGPAPGSGGASGSGRSGRPRGRRDGNGGSAELIAPLKEEGAAVGHPPRCWVSLPPAGQVARRAFACARPCTPTRACARWGGGVQACPVGEGVGVHSCVRARAQSCARLRATCNAVQGCVQRAVQDCMRVQCCTCTELCKAMCQLQRCARLHVHSCARLRAQSCARWQR